MSWSVSWDQCKFCQFPIAFVSVKYICKCEFAGINFEKMAVLKTWFYYSSTCELFFSHLFN